MVLKVLNVSKCKKKKKLFNINAFAFEMIIYPTKYSFDCFKYIFFLTKQKKKSRRKKKLDSHKFPTKKKQVKTFFFFFFFLMVFKRLKIHTKKGK